MVQFGAIFENNRMFQSKSVEDCDGEARRFLSTIRMDGDTSNSYISPFQTPIANRYSSSTDSTSPESYFNTPFQTTQPLEQLSLRVDTPKTYESTLNDSQPLFYDTSTPIFESPISSFDSHPSYSPFDRNVTGFQPQYDSTNTSFDRNFPVFEPQNYDQRLIGDTLFNLRRQRAIVGRKIIGCHSRMSANEALKSKTDNDFNIWQPLSVQTPETTQMQYELFPSNDKIYELRTPKISIDDYASNYTSTLTPNSSIMSQSSNMAQYDNWSPTSNTIQMLSPMSNRLQNPSPIAKRLPNPSLLANRLQNLPPPANKLPNPSLLANKLRNPSPPANNLPNPSLLANRLQNPSPPANNLLNPSLLANRLQNLSPPANRLQNPSPPVNMLQNLSPNSFNRIQNEPNKIPYPEFKPPFDPSLHTGTSSEDKIGQSKMCMFCRKNGETPTVYMSHCVKEKIGNKYTVTCPILRDLVCMTCGASGDDAHTISYCPVLRSTNNGKPLQSTTITLKNTRTKSNGRKRY